MRPFRLLFAASCVALPLAFACSKDDAPAASPGPASSTTTTPSGSGTTPAPTPTTIAPPRPPLTASEKVVEADVVAAAGATITLSDGAKLEIPAGALPKDEHLIITTRTVRDRHFLTYVIEPTGIALLKPAKLTFQYDRPGADEPLISVWESSILNPVKQSGVEKTDWLEGNVLARDTAARTMTVEVPHFTVFYASVAVDEYAYLVVDIPPEYLEPGDLAFVLTAYSGTPGQTWQPGHVAMFAGNRNNPAKSVGRVIEANGVDVAESTLDRVKTNSGHAYLGPRRYFDWVAGGGLGRRSLTTAEKAGVVTFLEAHLGDEYAYIGDQSLRFNGTSGDTFSCVGLCEAAFNSVGVNSLAPAQRVLVSTPLEMYWNTKPVEDIIVPCGAKVDIPVSAVILDPRSPYLATTFRGFYSKKQFYTVTMDPESKPRFKLTKLADGSYNLHYDAPLENGVYEGVQLKLYTEITATDPFGNPISLGKREPWQWVNVKVSCESGVDSGTGVHLPDAGDGTPDAGKDTGTPTANVTVTPISAAFSQATFSTTYSATIQNSSGVAVTNVWSGPNCASYAPMTPTTSSTTSQSTTMTWTHPHPPCDPTTDHASATIKLDVTWTGGGKQCTFQGAETGQGPVCTPK